MMAMPAKRSATGAEWQMPEGSDEDLAALKNSYSHLVELRDEVIEAGILPPLDAWKEANPNL